MCEDADTTPPCHEAASEESARASGSRKRVVRWLDLGELVGGNSIRQCWRTFKGVRLAAHPDASSCRRIRNPNAIHTKTGDLGAGAPSAAPRLDLA
jgi:hypothetical protein